jgi:hypothetical protein
VSYIGYFCLFARSGVQTLMLYFCFFFFFVLPVSLDGPFLISNNMLENDFFEKPFDVL